MNTALFKQATPSLEEVVSDWFKAHPGILDPMERAKVVIQTEMVCPVTVVVDGVDMPSTDSLEGILCQSVDVLSKHLPERFYRRRVKFALDCSCITTLRQLVQNNERQMVNKRYFGKYCLRHTKDALKEIDPRLHFGMNLPSSES